TTLMYSGPDESIECSGECIDHDNRLFVIEPALEDGGECGWAIRGAKWPALGITSTRASGSEAANNWAAVGVARLSCSAARTKQGWVWVVVPARVGAAATMA